MSNLDYAFTWLTKYLKGGDIMFGQFVLAENHSVEHPEQEVASAMAALEDSGLCGANYKAVAYCGARLVRGVNHVFFAEQTFSDAAQSKRLVLAEVNEFEGEYKVVPSSIVPVIG